MRPQDFINLAKNFTGGEGKENEIELPAPQGWYDRILNGINRTGRPLLLVAVVLFFIWGIKDPEYFTLVMKAYEETPEFVATAILMVIGIFGGGRIVGDFRRRGAVVRQTVSTTVEKGVDDETAEDMMSEGLFDNLDDFNPDVLADAEDIITSSPDNSAIDAWKNKNATV